MVTETKITIVPCKKPSPIRFGHTVYTWLHRTEQATEYIESIGDGQQELDEWFRLYWHEAYLKGLLELIEAGKLP